jgi:acid phosphatase (class A)
MKIKKHHNRPRPKVIAKKLKTKMQDMEMASMKTPSYPSGHSVQGYLIGMVLSDKYPQKRDKLMKNARDISYSRRVAHAHYKSDSLFGERIGRDMYQHIKNKT